MRPANIVALLRASLSLFFIASILSIDSLAQVITPGTQTGLPAFGTFHGSDIDVVSLQNQSLHAEIPVVSIPQRGGRSLDINFVYETQRFQLIWFPQPTPTNRYAGQYVTQLPSTGFAYGQWFLSGTGQWGLSYQTVPVTCTSISIDGSRLPTNTWYRDGYVVTDPVGTQHQIALYTSGIVVNPGPDCPPEGNATTGYAIDGSGIYVDLSKGTYLKDGTILSGMEDSNGNIMSNGPGSITVSQIGTASYTSPLGKTQQAQAYTLWTYTDSNGQPQNYRVDYALIDIQTSACTSGLFLDRGATCTDSPRSHLVPIKLTLPNNTSYQFTWVNASNGQLASMVLPSGGTITYTYYAAAFYNDPIPAGANVGHHGNYTGFARVQSRTLTDGATSSTWTYGLDGKLITPAGDMEQHVFQSLQSPAPSSIPYETSVSYFKGSGSTATLLKSVTKDYTGEAYGSYYGTTTLANVRVIRETTTLDNGLVSKVETDYDTFTQANTKIPTTLSLVFSRLNVVEKRFYDYAQGAPGPLLKRVHYTYLHDANPNPYLPPNGPNIANRVLTIDIYDGTGNHVAQTANEYDNYTHSSPNVSAGITPSGAINHDPAFGPSFVNRGNRTGVSLWRNTDSAMLMTQYQYDDAGNILAATDPLLHTTYFDWSDSWKDSSPFCPPVGGPVKAFLHKITDALQHTQTFQHYSCSGLLGSATDANQQTTSFSYDGLKRLTLRINPTGGGQASATYSDVIPPSIATADQIASGLNLGRTSLGDKLGRVVQTQLTSDPEGADVTDTTYDALGRILTQSNSHRLGASPTDGTTTYFYDALGRSCLVVPPDGTPPAGNICPITSPANDVATVYLGNTITVTDQTGKSRKSVADALGRLRQVFEDPAGLMYETDYTYDALNNLLRVDQRGGATDSAQWRTRTFAYNSLSQLLSATNPESGTITYNYDNDGNLISKMAPAPNQTAAATVTTTYAYDILKRLKQKSFNDGVTPQVTFGYDGVAPAGCTPSLSITFGIGRRTGMCDAAGFEAWSYDAMGRVLTDQRSTNSVTKNTTYTYNLDSSIATITYPSGRTITYQPGGAGRTLWAKDVANGVIFAGGSCGPNHDGACYAPQGALSFLQNGASIASTLYYNKRLQPCRISVKSTGTAPGSCADTANLGNILDMGYNFTLGIVNNGNVTAIANNRDSSRNQSFTYDPLNRITKAQTASTTGAKCWGEQFSYDAWGNLLSSGGITPQYNGCTQESGFSAIATAKNQVSGYGYDAAGNITATPSPVSASYTYNAENQLTAAALNTYKYDGDGRRVEKLNSAGQVYKIYWYGIGGDPIDETDAAGSSTTSAFNEYVFFGGKRIARRDSANNINYYFADHLGTARVVASATGTIVDDSDYYPFGGEHPIFSSSGNAYKFTGKERDSESGLDNFGARYMGSSLGRFMSPDSTASVKPINPQSWNLYGYALNNPLLYIDPTGHTVSLANCQDQNQCATLLGNAAQLPKGVTASVDKKGNLKLNGDLSKIKGGNAARLLQLVQSDKTVNFWIGDTAPKLGGGTKDVGGGTSGTTNQDYNQNYAVVQADPSTVDSGDLSMGAYLSPDGTFDHNGPIPGANQEEAAAHELLGHVWADLIGGQSAGTNGNKREALIAEDRVRNTDPARGLKIYHQREGVDLIKPVDLPRITNPGSQP